MIRFAALKICWLLVVLENGLERGEEGQEQGWSSRDEVTVVGWRDRAMEREIPGRTREVCRR